MNVRPGNGFNGLVSIILIASIGLSVTEALWIPIPRNTNRIPQLVRSNPQRQSPKSAIEKRDGISNPVVPFVEDNGDQGTDEGYDDLETSWPITPRACLVLMKILYAQTAEAIERGNQDQDFYDVASYYQPAIPTIAKCMDMAARGGLSTE